MHNLEMRGNGVAGFIEVPEPIPGPGEVVVKTAASAICGSEMGPYRTTGKPGGNSGHEAAGIVAALGTGDISLKIGQRVGVSAVAGCGNAGCPQCAAGRYTWCENRKGYSNMHAEKFLIAANACHALPDDLPWDAAVLICGDGLGVPYHTSTKIPADARTIAVFGAGPIGLGNILMQRYLGRTLIAVDKSAFRLNQAKRLGAEYVMNPDECDVIQEVKKITGGGADVCIEAAGRPETAFNCFAAVRTGGTVIFNGEQPAIPLSPSEHFIRRDITAVGAWFYHFCEYDQMLELWRKGLKMTDLISDHRKYADAPQAFKDFSAGKTAKVILEYEE
ncbi:MAG: Sorbitol dehydrogenase [Lentisphaerae bacterium ADurb.Bin242]|nr:MAG: Sorbitol dehydrogenase [Lentisphaerae bacterium ADurb.Bin242]